MDKTNGDETKLRNTDVEAETKRRLSRSGIDSPAMMAEETTRRRGSTTPAAVLGILGPNDNLLIYYAGHGYRLKSDKLENGYWLPRNAERPPNDTFWVPNEQITSHIGRLQAKRVLVVADSCYAGLLSTDPSFFFLDKPTEVSKDYVMFKLPKRSRLLIASGGDNPVLDEGGQGNSVFAKAFLDVLEANDGIMTAPALFSMVQGKVKEGALRNHFAQQPEFKSIKGAGHEVGDFFFVPLSRVKT